MSVISLPKISGYVGVRYLSSGLMCRLYEAIRIDDDMEVILKLPIDDPPTEEQLSSLEHEHEILCSLSRSKSVPKVVDMIWVGKLPILIQEKLKEPSLETALKKRKKFNTEEFISFALSATEAIRNIHKFDIVHQDINPFNILYDPHTKSSKIIDFDLSIAISHHRTTPKKPTQLRGTLAFISPEQTGRVNRGVDYRTDYYSLGVTFYLTATGVFPFKSKDPFELVYSQIADLPRPPIEENPEIPKPISDLILKLLAKDPEERYQSIAGIRHDLLLCKAMLAEGKIEPFQIGAHETFEKFQIPDKIYGRKKESDILFKKYEEVATGGTGYVSISGYSGVGKTSLVQEMHHPVVRKLGKVISGKYDKYKSNIPYLAFYQAFDEYIKELLKQSDEALDEFKYSVLNTLGTNTGLMVDLVPSLELIVGKQLPVQEVGLEENRNRFAYVFTQFVECLPTKEVPLVIFLDDLQWADTPSMLMLKQLIQKEIPYLLFVIGYRDNEVDESHFLSVIMRDLKEEGIQSLDIYLRPLGLEDTSLLIADTLRKDVDRVGPLAEVCYKKTLGNPFFLIEFLNLLHETGLFSYDWSEDEWVWDLNKINSADISDNVVGLLSDKINSFSPSEKLFLSTAACLGSVFEIDLIEHISKLDKKEIRHQINSFMKKEIFISKEENYYSSETFQFSHDRIRQAAYDLLTEEKEAELHVKIADYLVESSSSEELHESIHLISDHYNKAFKLLEGSLDRSQKKRIVSFNLEAAKEAKASASYDMATNYCDYALRWLGKIDWKANYPLLIEIYSERAESSYLAGKIELMEESCEIIFSHCREFFDEYRAIKTKILHHFSKLEYDKAISLGLKALNGVGVHIPLHPSKVRVLYELLRVKYYQLTTAYDLNILLKYPAVDREYKEVVFYLLVLTGFISYFSGRKNLWTVVILQGVFLSTYNREIYAYTPIAIISYASIHSVLGAFQTAREYGKVAEGLVEKGGNLSLLAEIKVPKFAIVDHWLSDFPSPESYMSGYYDALKFGNLFCAALCLAGAFVSEFYSGRTLDEITESLKAHKKAIFQLKSPLLIMRATNLERFVQKLTVPEKSEIEIVDFDIHEKGDRTIYSGPYVGEGYLFTMIYHYLMQDYQGAFDVIDKAEQCKHAPGHYMIPVFEFYKALTLMALYNKNSFLKRLGMRRDIKKIIKSYKKWAANCPQTYLHKSLILQAEWAKTCGKFDLSSRFFEKATESAGKSGFLQDEALAYELCSRFSFQKSSQIMGELFLEKACHLYKKWGAVTKLQQLKEEFGEILEKYEDKGHSPALPVKREGVTITSTMDLETFAVDSIQKSTEAIASTILIDELIVKLIKLAIKHSGAEKCILIIKREDEYFIEAEGGMKDGESNLMHSQKMSDKTVPISVINTVARSMKPLILKEAYKDKRFALDPYIKNNQVRSLFSLPFVNNAKITAILYLENNLFRDAFTPEKEKVLTFLSSQLAMSIDNAKLYQNTVELNKAYERFVPKDYIPLLEKERIVDVKIGDQRLREMTALFMDIRGFTGISEKLTPEETFAFINGFLGIMEPVIRAHGGFIDKYIGDAVMALFPRCADDAVRCGLKMLDALDRFNKVRMDRGESEVRIGIGINTGMLILGTVGNEYRMDCTVLSDAVNIASRVEHLCKEFKKSLLITGYTYEKLDNPEYYNLIKIGKTALRGKKEAVTLYSSTGHDL